MSTYELFADRLLLQIRRRGSSVIGLLALPCLAFSAYSQTNLALNRPAGSLTYCSGCGGSYSATQAVDGNPNTAWIATNNTYPQWMVVDLGAIYTLTSVNQTFHNSDTWFYKVEGSTGNAAGDDTQWTTLADHTQTGVTGQNFVDSVSGNFRYVRLYVTGSQAGNWATSNEFQVLGTILVQPRNVVPAPVPLSTGNYLVGMQSCNFWDNATFWNSVAALPTVRPIRGYYNEAYDVSVDWNIKMAADHGINFFMPCWYRMANNAGQSPVLSSYDQFINSLANFAQYRGSMKWAVDWIQDKNALYSDVSNLSDFENNVVPFWLNNYFNRSNYLIIDNKPVVAIYDYVNFENDLGGATVAQQALAQARQQAIAAGYAGILFLTQNSGTTTNSNADAATAGYDYIFAYELPVNTELMPSKTPTDAQVIAAQQQAWTNWADYSQVPSIVIASVGFDSFTWGEGTASYFNLTPPDFKTLLTDAQGAMANRPAGLQQEMILLDNWSEFGEGHILEPTQQYGYGYLDAIASAFSPGATPVDTMPDITKIPQVINPVYSIASSYTTSNSSGPLNLAVPSGAGNLSSVSQQIPAAGNLQQWVLDPGPIGSYYLRNVATNDVMTAANGYAPNALGVPIQIFPNLSLPQQLWQPTLTPTASLPFQNTWTLGYNSQALSLGGGGSQALQPGDPVQTYTYFGSTEQLWNLGEFPASEVTPVTTGTTPAGILLVSGNDQTASIGNLFTNPLVVEVVDSRNNPVPNVTVSFTAPASGSSAVLSSATKVTGPDGLAAVAATANSQASSGGYNVVASVAGMTSQVNYALVNAPANCRITLDQLNKTYTGAPLRAVATTNPTGLPVSITYNGSAQAPTAEGTYTLVGMSLQQTMSGVLRLRSRFCRPLRCLERLPQQLRSTRIASLRREHSMVLSPTPMIPAFSEEPRTLGGTRMAVGSSHLIPLRRVQETKTHISYSLLSQATSIRSLQSYQ